MVTNELRGEKVDIVPFSEDQQEFVMRALQPAKVKEVRLDEETGTATVIVHDFQLSLAIGKEGQNARLAARLTGWRIDIKSETQIAEEEAGYEGEEWAEGEWVTDPESGELVWKDAEGATVSAAEYAAAAEETGAGSRRLEEPSREPSRCRSSRSQKPSRSRSRRPKPRRPTHNAATHLHRLRTQSMHPARSLGSWPLPDKEVAWSRASAGRGAWLCADSPDCIAMAQAPQGVQPGAADRNRR